ncbi:hypothetical protein [Heyndrickxia sporothermodurans]|uniref:hypothetical protein n=1 Tax=Heyndrickxia sporothermodurans TaxID=46224 RepID=UPI002E1EEA6D|nr:hypothetical protein [Heyndrickxia sporothermodurans]MED3697956.1 hypothetical protein [Heyndrickxia sporothermodurans]
MPKSNQPAEPTFQWISNEGSNGEYITIDSQRRFYLSAGTRALFNDAKSLIVGYDAVNKRLVVAKPDVVRAANVKPYSFDKRWYASARHFVKNAGISEVDLPLRFNYVGKDYADTPTGSHTFQLAEYDAPDGGLVD